MKHRKPTPAWQKLGLRVSKKLAVGATSPCHSFRRTGSRQRLRTGEHRP